MVKEISYKFKVTVTHVPIVIIHPPMEESRESIVLIRFPSQKPSNRSVSPINTAMGASDKPCSGVKLFRVLARTLGRRAQKHLQQDELEEDSRSSSTDSFYSSVNKLSKGESCSSGESSGTDFGYINGQSDNFGLDNGFVSGSSSDTGSESAGQGSSERPSRASSFRKAFQNLTITRSQSTDGISTKPPKRQKKSVTPKRILRPPVTYTYVRGISGLPTQRIPRSTQSRSCCYSPQKTR